MLPVLLSRASTAELTDPSPDEAALQQILAAAVRAPDHGKLRPWHFCIIRGEARNQLGDLFAEALLHREPDSTPAQVAKERAKPLRSPLTIAVIAQVVEGHKIPVFEQILSAGAAAMNILNAAHALGFGAKWVTGANCYDPCFLAEFGLEPTDQLAGFIHIGTPKSTPSAERLDPALLTTEWPLR
jgi:nitroreductase